MRIALSTITNHSKATWHVTLEPLAPAVVMPGDSFSLTIDVPGPPHRATYALRFCTRMLVSWLELWWLWRKRER